jgi:hypothetical protein
MEADQESIPEFPAETWAGKQRNVRGQHPGLLPAKQAGCGT